MQAKHARFSLQIVRFFLQHFQLSYKAFRHVETVFVQGNQVGTDQNKPHFLITKKGSLF